jgi:hypothetical protein
LIGLAGGTIENEQERFDYWFRVARGQSRLKRASSKWKWIK